MVEKDFLAIILQLNSVPIYEPILSLSPSNSCELQAMSLLLQKKLAHRLVTLAVLRLRFRQKKSQEGERVSLAQKNGYILSKANYLYTDFLFSVNFNF